MKDVHRQPYLRSSAAAFLDKGGEGVKAQTMIGPNEGEVLSTADALWPLALLYLVSCGALGVGSLALLRHESKRAPAKEEEDDRDLVALEGHEGSLPGEQDWLVVAFFLLVASYLGGLISLETGAAAALTFGLAFGLGRAQGLRDAAAASKGADAALPVPKARRRVWRRVARARPGGMRRVRSASSLIN